MQWRCQLSGGAMERSDACSEDAAPFVWRRLMALAAAVPVAACAHLATPSPRPSDGNARVRTEMTWAFPFAVFDAGTVQLMIVAVDGREVETGLSGAGDRRAFPGVAYLAPGPHSLVVQARQGPTGMFGPTGLLGMCQGSFQFDARPDASYRVRFVKDKDGGRLQLLMESTSEVVHDAPCLSLR